MTEKTYQTNSGTIHYWISRCNKPNAKTICFLPGLTADHTLFVRQIGYFSVNYNVLVWDAPAHGKSRPFQLDFTMEDLARFLHEILIAEKIENPILVGQSLGGYISQMYIELYLNEVSHFVSIDSAPLQRKYYQQWEIWSLKHIENMYMCCPWHLLVKIGTRGVSESIEGRANMKSMMLSYSKKEYCKLAGFGYKMLAEAVEQNRPYQLTCPTLLICGQYDQAGSVKKYNKDWTRNTGFSLVWIPNAGHNSNIDNPEAVNNEIENFIRKMI